MGGRNVVLCCWGGRWEENKLIGGGQRVWLDLLEYDGAETCVTVRFLLFFIVNEYAVPPLYGSSIWLLQKKEEAVYDFYDLSSIVNVSIYNRQ